MRREFDLLRPRLRVIVVLGAYALAGVLPVLAERGIAIPKPKPKFGHGNEIDLGNEKPRIIMSFHPSQQNTFTGKLTQDMFDSIWKRARAARGK